jgi:predicted nucleic acid-binding protein
VKIYLDLCAIQRPLDTANQIRIALEAEAVLGIIRFSDNEQVELLSSEALIYEGEQSGLPIRREHTRAVLAKARSIVNVAEKDSLRAANLMTFGIKPLDALHLALAESGKADYFCTCDDKLLQNSKRIPDLMIKVVNPVDLVQEIEK